MISPRRAFSGWEYPLTSPANKTQSFSCSRSTPIRSPDPHLHLDLRPLSLSQRSVPYRTWLRILRWSPVASVRRSRNTSVTAQPAYRLRLLLLRTEYVIGLRIRSNRLNAVRPGLQPASRRMATLQGVTLPVLCVRFGKSRPLSSAPATPQRSALPRRSRSSQG